MQKRILAILMALSMIIMISPISVFAATSKVAINSTNFPDANFRKYVKDNFDTNGDSALSADEIEAVDDIDVTYFEESTYGQISSLAGIEYFTSLLQFGCDGNLLTELDLSKNTKLILFSCRSNKITKLTLGNNTELLAFDCTDNNITEIDLTKCPNVVEYYCDEHVAVSFVDSMPVVKVSRVNGTKPDGTKYYGKAKLTWNEMKNGDEVAEEYHVYRATSKTGSYQYLGKTTTTSYTNYGAPSGKTYYYRVIAIFKELECEGFYGEDAEFDKYAGSKLSEPVGFTTTCDTPVVTLSRVSGTTSSGTKYKGKAKLSWKAVTGAKEYEVYRATSKNGSYSLLGKTTGTSYTNSGAPSGTTFYYKVKAISKNSSDANSNFSSIKTFTTSCDTPSVTIALVNGKPKLTWKAVTGAKEYEVYRATSKTGTYKKLGTTTKTSFHNTGAPSGKTCYYKVKAISKNSTYANSSFSSIKSIISK